MYIKLRSATQMLAAWKDNRVPIVCATEQPSYSLKSLYETVKEHAKRSLHPKQKMAALALRGGAVVSLATNGAQPGAHAEWRALRRVGYADTVVVARENGGISKPCPYCDTLLRKIGVRRVVYADWNGLVVIERLT